MTTITTHHVEGADNKLKIETTGEANQGGDYSRYVITGFDAHRHHSAKVTDQAYQTVILFQNGPIPEFGVNGITLESLLAIAGHRLECFQAGPFASSDNQEALEHIQKAIECLHRRTKNRIARNVEGKMEK